MNLEAGTRIGVYEVIALLGAGGMGQVYRARDAKLGRDVAIKILPGHFLVDKERVARFEREARTLASLNHPNIAQIYGLEGDGSALVMELVEGEDLSAILNRGPVAVADALPIAKQIAQALEAAHELGIVHRDLKPANIKVRADGTVKVLDFGLAKAMDPSGGVSGSLANSPTITSPATEMGMILGTAAYMSPEQARGKAVDRRADVWAFGVVLYEMLSGRRAFEGSEVSDVLASVLKDRVSLETVPADTPAAIRRLLRRCLEKNRADRLDSMATARFEIADAIGDTRDGLEPAASGIAPVASRARTPNLALAFGAIAAAAIMFAVWVWFRSAPAAADRVVRFSIELPQGRPRTDVAVSGSDTIVYSAGRLYVRRISESESRVVPGTEGGRMPFTSPDGKSIGFYAGGKLKKISISGGDPLALADVDTDSPGASWGYGNRIFFSPGWNSALFSVSADGGEKPAAASTVDTAAGELSHWWPEPLPDGKTLLFTVWMAGAGINDSKIAALDIATGTHRILMPGSNPKYLATGQLLFFHAGTFQIVAFDPVALRATGDPIKVLPDARALDPTGSGTKSIAVSSTGTLVYLSGALEPEMQFAWATQGGAFEPIPAPAERWVAPRLAPDGKRIAGARSEGGIRSLWLRDLSLQTTSKVDAPGATFDPFWSPTGDFLLFTSMRKGHFDTFMLRPGDGVIRPIIEDPYDQGPFGVTHDGKRMVLFDSFSDGSILLTVADIEKPAVRTPLPIKAAGVGGVEVSPDDHWIAATPTASGRREVVVLPLSGPGATVSISSRGGASPLWSRSGSKLYYQRDDELVAVPYSVAGGRFIPAPEQTLFRLGGYDLLDIAPDNRFLVSRDTPGQERKIQVVVNWFGELRK